MSQSRHQQAKELFLAAAEIPAGQRREFLLQRCSGDDELRRDVESLLAFHEDRTADDRAGAIEGGEDTIGPYRVLRKLGSGGMGEVFLAHDPRLDRHVAIKALPVALASDPARRQRFTAEARTLARVSHPNVAGIYGVEERAQQTYLVLEYVEGESLGERLARGPLPVDEALTLGAQIAAGLEAAHAAGVIHRDLKPANVMLTRTGEAKVLDFGLARWTRPEPGSGTEIPSDGRTPTAPGAILGTPAYMSPEQARGKPVDRTSDTWALGCVLFECLTGRTVFAGETISDSIAKILEGEPDWDRLPDGVPPRVHILLRRCLSKDPRQRLQHPGDARIELSEAGTPAHKDLPADRRPTSRRAGVPWWLAAALVSAAIAGGFLAALTWTRGNDPQAPAAARRLSINLADQAAIATSDLYPLGIGRTALALSPDDRHLVYVAAHEGSTRLIHRPLDAFEHRPLPDTEGAFAPFFSPDGRSVGFFTDGFLRRIDLAGGGAVTVTEARNPYGGTWAQDGIIHFAEAEGSALVSVRANGGQRREQQVRSAFWPQALPGGQLLAALPVGVIDPATGRRTDLAEGSFARYLDGRLAFVQSGRLLTAPFDGDTAELLGPPSEIAAEVHVEQLGTAQLAVGRRTVAYLPGRAITPRTLVWADREGGLQPAFGEPRSYGHLDLSPDGQRLVATIYGLRAGLWIHDLSRRSASRISRVFHRGLPVWSATDDEIFFCIYEDGRDRAYRLSADGTGTPTAALPQEIDGCIAATSGDGRWLVVNVYDTPDTAWDIVAVTTDGSRPPVPIATEPAYEWGGSISPDGRWVAYTSDVSDRYEVFAQGFPEAGRRWQVSTDGGEEPIWSADGRELIYRNGRRWMSVQVGAGPEPTFSAPRLLLEGDYENVPGNSYEVGRDGRLLLLQPESGETFSEIRLLELPPP